MLGIDFSLKSTKIVYMLVLVLFLGALMVFLFISKSEYYEAKTIGEDITSFKELSDRFVDLADEKGAIYAFEVLKRATLPPQTDLHLLGHFVGDELYKQEGIDGIQYCTPDFRNACSHTIVIGTLTEFGEGALPLIRDACTQAPGGSGAYTMCFHGLGHGVFAGYGYEFEETIDFCKQTGTEEYNQREYIECFGGAIMEFTGGGAHDPELIRQSRKKYQTGPLAPCMSDVVPDELKGICLTYLTPQIWESAGISLGTPDQKKFGKAFSFCEAIPEDKTDWRRACYSGFGKEFVPLAGKRDIRNISNYSNSDFARAIGWCSYAGNAQGQEWCINEGLDSVFWGGENDPEASFRYCSVVGEVTNASYKASCEDGLYSNIEFYIQQEEQRNLCTGLSEKFQEQCLNRVQ